MFGDVPERPCPARSPGATLVDSVRDESIDYTRHDCHTITHMEGLAAWIGAVYAPTGARRAENEAALAMIRQGLVERRAEILREEATRRRCE